jgi:hypothetical protein
MENLIIELVKRKLNAPKGTKKPLPLLSKSEKKSLDDLVLVPGYGRVKPDQVKKLLGESSDSVDTINMTVPLFIRCLEWAHEEAKDDVELHKFVEKVIAKGGKLTTSDYMEMLPEGFDVEEGLTMIVKDHPDGVHSRSGRQG